MACKVKTYVLLLQKKNNVKKNELWIEGPEKGRESLEDHDSNRHIFKLNLGSWHPHLSTKQMKAFSMNPLSGDTEISRSVTLCC